MRDVPFRSSNRPTGTKRMRVAHDSGNGTFRVRWLFADGVWSTASLQEPPE